MSVLVTGTTGYLGPNVVNRLREEGYEVRAVVRDNGSALILPEDVELCQADITKPETLDAAFEGVKAVVHLAASLEGDEAKMQNVNVSGTETIVEKVAEFEVESFVFLSTINAHPDVPRSPETPYERTKAAASDYIRRNVSTASYTILYPSYIMGPEDYRLARFSFFKTVASNLILVPPLYRHRSYNVVHIDDVLDTIMYGLEISDSKNEYAVTGENITARRLYKYLGDQVDGTCFVAPVPKFVTKHVTVRAIAKMHSMGISPIDGSSFLQSTDLGTVPEEFKYAAPVPQRKWKRALTEMYEWYREIGVLN